MQWENLTSLDFERAVEACDGVGIIPIGVLEPHGPHLPLGTDMFEAHAVACRGAEVEPAIVFPAYPYGINHESAHLPGSVVFSRDLVLAILEAVCDEMARHGLRKIILFSGHGGNRFLVPLFVQTLVEKGKAYAVYEAQVPFGEGAEDLLETEETGHACEKETSTALYLHPDLVKMGQVPPEPFTNLKRNQLLQQAGLYSPLDWYAMYPAMYVGDPSKATAHKGEVMIRHRVEGLAAAIRAVKEDTMTLDLLREFRERREHPTAPGIWTKPKP
ncbi:MAG: creatininase family protein [Anaerolineae bacterium]